MAEIRELFPVDERPESEPRTPESRSEAYQELAEGAAILLAMADNELEASKEKPLEGDKTYDLSAIAEALETVNRHTSNLIEDTN